MTALLTDNIFCNQRGVPYRSLCTAFEQAVRKAGLANFAFHDLRHTLASRLVMNGVDLPTMQELLGHKSIAMTLRYTHFSSDDKQCAVSTLEYSGEKVPAIFPTAATTQSSTRPQVLDLATVPR